MFQKIYKTWNKTDKLKFHDVLYPLIVRLNFCLRIRIARTMDGGTTHLYISNKKECHEVNSSMEITFSMTRF